MLAYGLTFMTMFLLPAQGERPNPWKEKLPAAVARAEAQEDAASLLAVLDAAWRADDWQTGLRFARRAKERFAQDARLTASACRALWRAGRLVEAEEAARALTPATDDRVALHMLITLHLARGEAAAARAAADRLEALPSLSAADLSYVLAARMDEKRFDRVAKLLREAQRLTDPQRGYPETIMAESMEGIPEFLDAVGPEPLNRVATFGSADMPVTPLINLPGCLVTIDGKGPYRMVLDTGGSIMLSVDVSVAEDAGLRKLAAGSVRGVSGKTEAWQSLAQRVQIGDIVCERVMVRVFDVRKATMFACDGIIGTGIFADARMTLDFGNAHLVVAPSDAAPAKGLDTPLRLIGDAKLVTPVTVHGEPAAALLDSGADAVALSPTRLRLLFPELSERELPVSAAGVGGGLAPRITLSRGVDLVFASRTYENVSGLGLDVLDSVLSSFMGVQADVLIGMPVFREMRSFTVDYPACRMWVDWLDAE